MTITLFEAAQSVREQLDQVDPETGELAEDCIASLDLFRAKATACVAYAIEEGLAIESAAEFVKALAAKIEARKKRHGLFIEYISGSMKATGVHEIKHEHGLFKAKLHLGRDESVVLDDGAAFQPELCNDPKPPTPSKTKIKAAIKAGEAVAGAVLVRSDRLTIS